MPAAAIIGHDRAHRATVDRGIRFLLCNFSWQVQIGRNQVPRHELLWDVILSGGRPP
jgi:hypothetical protein